eukprot:TRINITY_DN11876_c0_g2_i1.p1 TRINITY_DN11876_c0_g2~~TRINITY_DN11876_c0_g2_i1.p1  ORF type:complete len:158 (+),score=9.06 TRINITY_DN11876_c0_g2_i1:251-724(+)
MSYLAFVYHAYPRLRSPPHFTYSHRYTRSSMACCISPSSRTMRFARTESCPPKIFAFLAIALRLSLIPSSSSFVTRSYSSILSTGLHVQLLADRLGGVIGSERVAQNPFLLHNACHSGCAARGEGRMEDVDVYETYLREYVRKELCALGGGTASPLR